jgi:UDP-N-acetylglucosamine--N-acetylmuramyl-(pentapeptide) pyrophosphoryl-undecaprenol N-acetylglucosamine transferase
MKVVLAGGGTGGHVYPALAMGDALKARGHEVIYVGAPDRLEARVAPEKGYEFHPLRAPKYPRGGLVGKIKFAFSLLASILRARKILKRTRPDLVLGVGGYIMAPTVLAAKTLGISRVVHEANVTPGMANRLCAKHAQLVLLTYAATEKKLNTDAPFEIVGCPVNPRILTGNRAEALERYGLSPDQPVLTIVGGSLGASTLNAIALASARQTPRNWQILWITGPRFHEEVMADLGMPPKGVCVVDYENRMQDAYAASTLVVARAGSSTLSELTALGLPALLIPSPNVTDNHQEANARGLEKEGAAWVLVEKDLDMTKAVSDIETRLHDSEALKTMALTSKAQGRLGVAENVAEILISRFAS